MWCQLLFQFLVYAFYFYIVLSHSICRFRNKVLEFLFSKMGAHRGHILVQKLSISACDINSFQFLLHFFSIQYSPKVYVDAQYGVRICFKKIEVHRGQVLVWKMSICACHLNFSSFFYIHDIHVVLSGTASRCTKTFQNFYFQKQRPTGGQILDNKLSS